jgi:hypothetical protein
LPAAAELSQKMKTYALALHVSKTPKSIEFYRILQKQSLQRFTALMLCISYALAAHISKTIKSIEFYRILQSRVFDDSPL